MTLLTPVTFGSDQGARCTCGGTIYGYRVMGERVDTQCYTCHATNYFNPYTMPQTAAECSQAHRASQE